MRRLDDPSAATDAIILLRNAALAAVGLGDLTRAHEALGESLARARRAHDHAAVARASVISASVHRLEGDLGQARARLADAGALRDRSGAAYPIAQGALTELGLGDIARNSGDLAAARAHYRDLLTSPSWSALALATRGLFVIAMGLLAGREGNHARSARLLGAAPPEAIAMMRMHFPDVEHDYRAGQAAAGPPSARPCSRRRGLRGRR